jgi:hypothetical protein
LENLQNDSAGGGPGKLYVAFMQELKDRLFAVQDMLRSLPSGGGTQGYLTAEASYLQVRFICELLALAALAAHEPIGLTKRLRTSWNADEIFKALERINDRCFPMPIRFDAPDGSGKAFHLAAVPGLVRTDLRAIYGACGDALHRGVIQSVLDGRERRYDLDQLNRWCAALWMLLREHVVYVPQLGIALLTRLDADPKTPVQVITAMAETE